MRGRELIRTSETITLGIRDSRIDSHHKEGRNNAGEEDEDEDEEFQNDMAKKGALSIKYV